MYKLLFVGDEHNADMPPSTRYGTYKTEILAKEREIIEIAKVRGVDVIVRSGDIFHLKTPSNVSHGLTTELSKIWLSSGIPNYTAIGNHDIRFGKLESLPEQPLHELVVAKAVEIIPEEGIKLHGESGLNIRLSSIHGYGNPDEDPDRSRYYSSHPSAVNIKVCHSSLLPPTVRFPGGHWTNLDQVSNKGTDIFLVGHIHDYFGIHKHGDSYMVSPGSICRGSLPELKIDRTVRVVEVGIISKTNFVFDEIELKSVRPVQDVFRHVERKRRSERTDAKVAEYVDYLTSTTTTVRSFSLKAVTSEAITKGTINKEVGEYLNTIYEKVGAK